MEFSDCVKGASGRSTFPDMSCAWLSSSAKASLGEGALKASTDSRSRVDSGLFRADCLGRGLTLGGIVILALAIQIYSMVSSDSLAFRVL